MAFQNYEDIVGDYDAYVKAHAPRMIERLCALGAEEQKAGDALGAAADYNRALAHAPDDAKLIRIVAGMQRAVPGQKVDPHLEPAPSAAAGAEAGK